MAARRRPLDTRTTSLLGRSRAERLLDSAYSQQTRELQKRRIASKRLPTNSQRAVKTENDVREAKRHKVEKPVVVRARSPVEALELMLKHIDNRQKFPKVIKMFLQLLESGHMIADEKIHFVHALFVLASSDNCTTCPESRKDVMKIFESYALPLCQQPSCPTGESAAYRIAAATAASGPAPPAAPSLELSQQERMTLEVALIPALFHNGIQTDDTYDFITYIGHLSNVFDRLRSDLSKFGYSTDDDNDEWNESCSTGAEQNRQLYGNLESVTSSGGGTAVDDAMDLESDSEDESGSYVVTSYSPETISVERADISEENDQSQQATHTAPIGASDFSDKAFDQSELMNSSGSTDIDQSSAISVAEGPPAVQDIALPSDSPRFEPTLSESSSNRKFSNSGAVDGINAETIVNNVEQISEFSVAATVSHPLPSTTTTTTDANGASSSDNLPKLPSRRELRNLRRLYFLKALGTVFTLRNVVWARAAVEELFQKVYRNRHLFDDAERSSIESWQTLIKVRKVPSLGVTALKIGEAANPVRDSREEIITTVHGAAVWSAKQTGL